VIGEGQRGREEDRKGRKRTTIRDVAHRLGEMTERKE